MTDASVETGARRPVGRPRKDAGTSIDTRDRLLEAAEEAFVELGYEGVTINEIVRRAGYTTGAIYNHFDGKAELLIEVVRRVLNRIRDVVLAATAGDTLQAQGTALVDAWFALSRPDRLTLAEVHLAAARHERVAVLLDEAIVEALEASRAGIEAAQATGEADPDLDAARLARILIVFCAGLNHLDTIDPKMSDDKVTRQYLAEWIAQLYQLPVGPARNRRRRLGRRR